VSYGRIDVDLRSLDKAIKRAARAGADLRPVWRELRRPLRKDQGAHIKEQKGPQGSSWPGLAASTKTKRLGALSRAGKAFTKKGALRKAAKRKIGRVLSRRLVSGARIRAKPKEIKITSIVKWAGVHQEGGRVGRGSQIPARPFMWISDELLAITKREMVKYLSLTWKGKRL